MPQIHHINSQVASVGIMVYVVGFVLISNTALHINLFYLTVAVPFLVQCLTRGRSIWEATKAEPLYQLIWLYCFYSLVINTNSVSVSLPKLALNSLCLLALVYSVKSLAENRALCKPILLTMLPILTGIYILLVSAAFMLAAQGTQTSLEKFLISLGVDGYGYLRDFPYYRENWSQVIPRLDVGSNDLSNPSISAAFFGLILLTTCGFGGISSNLLRSLFVALLLTGMVLTQTRMPLVAALVILSIWALTPLQPKKTILFLAASLVLLGLIYSFEPHGMSRLFSLEMGARHAIYQACLADGLGNPWFGLSDARQTPPFSLSGIEYQHCHNVFLDALRSSGVFGLGLLLAIQLFAAKTLWNSPQKNLLLGIHAFVVGCLLTDSTYPIAKPNFHWLLFWLPVCLALGQNLINQKENLSHEQTAGVTPRSGP